MLKYVTGSKSNLDWCADNVYWIHIFAQVKYLGEEGESTPLAGAASICSPWDLVVSCWTWLTVVHSTYNCICNLLQLSLILNLVWHHLPEKNLFVMNKEIRCSKNLWTIFPMFWFIGNLGLGWHLGRFLEVLLLFSCLRKLLGEAAAVNLSIKFCLCFTITELSILNLLFWVITKSFR